MHGEIFDGELCFAGGEGDAVFDFESVAKMPMIVVDAALLRPYHGAQFLELSAEGLIFVGQHQRGAVLNRDLNRRKTCGTKAVIAQMVKGLAADHDTVWSTGLFQSVSQIDPLPDHGKVDA